MRRSKPIKPTQLSPALTILIVASICSYRTSHADCLQFNSGKTLECRILAASQTNLFVELPASSASKTVETDFALADLRRIGFSKSFPDSNGKLDPAFSYDTLDEIWKAFHPIITRPGNGVALVGLNLSAMMLESKDPSLTDQAFKILEFVKFNACDPAYQIQAADAEIQALERLKRFVEARSVALKFTGGRNPLHLQLRANLTVGICGHEEMRIFLEENPRWQHDPGVQKERQAIYERTLDSYSFTSLFGGENEQLSARALYQEALFRLLCAERTEADRIYKKLCIRFQNSIYTEQLKNELSIVIQAREKIGR